MHFYNGKRTVWKIGMHITEFSSLAPSGAMIRNSSALLAEETMHTVNRLYAYIYIYVLAILVLASLLQ